MPTRKIIIPTFFVLLFLLRYYDFFVLYQPVQPFSTGFEPTLETFTLYNYLLRVILLAFKFLLIAIVLSAGIFLEGKINKNDLASLKDSVLLAVLSEYVYFLSDISKIFQFTFVNTYYTYEDCKDFSPLTLFDLLEIESGSNYAYFFQAINVFELSYIVCLILGLRKLQYAEGTKAFSVTLASYGGALMIWILTVTYFTLR